MNAPMSPELSRRIARAVQTMTPPERGRVWDAIEAAADEAALRAALPAVGVRV